MTLFDEASIATFTECPQMLWLAAVGNPSSSRNYLEPLPTKFAWADNYVSLVGNLHPEAANVILTEGLPTRASGILDLIDQAADFHSYPSTWYQETIETDISTMGHRWSFERGGFPGAPTPGTVFRQASSGSEWDLAQTTYDDGADMLESRWQTYHRAVITTAAQTIGAGLRGGNVFGLSIYGAPIDVNMVLHLITSFSGGDSPEPAPHPLGGDVSGAGGSYIPAYAWIPVTVPSNAVSMSFDFLLEGYGQNDSFAAALDGTNVLSVELSLLKTNVALNSGLIDVSSYAGQQVEFFLGIVGGTSTNASVTVSNFQFYVSAPPTLQVKFAGTNFLVSWPLPALDFILQTSTNLADSNSWVTLTNIPAIVNFQNTITNPITGGASFFRLRK